MADRNFDLIERGDGPTIVLVPGIQGRWEYSRGLVDALARSHRVVTFSLADERTGPGAAVSGMDVFAQQVESALDRLYLDRAIVVGVSFGGLVALRFAATRPSRAERLVLISAPGPQWHLRPRHEFYARLPWVFGPVFLAEAPLRLGREVMAALPDWPGRRQYVREQMRTAVTARISLSRMAARARLIGAYDRTADCAHVTSPTLVVQGDESLDHVTGAGGTAEYARLIADATLARLPDTGHLGSVTRAAECAALVCRFLAHPTKDTHHSAA